MNKNIDTLKNIVSGSLPRVDLDKVYSDHQSKEVEEVIKSFSHLTPDKRYSRWLDWSKNKQLNPNLKWEKNEELYPGSNFRENTISKINLELKNKRSNNDKGDFFQQELPSWPDWLIELYKDQASNSIPFKKQAELSEARINNKLATRETLDVLSPKLMGFTGSKSAASHASDVREALNLGFTPDKMHVNEEGHLTVPKDGKMVPVYAIDKKEYPKNSPMEDFILKRDTASMIEEEIEPYVLAAQNDAAEANRAKNRMLFRSLGKDTYGDLEEFELDIIYNAAMDDLDKDKTMLEGLNMITYRDFKKFTSPFDAVASHLQKAHKIGELVDRRKLDA
jgi:hypothetical protein